MPFAYNSVCYVDENAALAAFEQAFTPITTIDAGMPYQWILNNRVVDATGEIMYDLIRADYPANPPYASVTQFYYLSPCDLITQGYSYADAAAMWGFAFSSVFMLWYLAKNLGLIINAVRRW